MATEFDVEMTFGSSAEDVFEMLCDHEYQELKCTETGGSDIEVIAEFFDDDTVELTMKRTVPADVPSFAKSLVGETIAVVETYQWGPAGEDGSRTAEVLCTFGRGDTITFSGQVTMSENGSVDDSERTVFQMRAAAKAKIPMMAGKIEKMVRDQTLRAAKKENEVGRNWLGT